MDLMQREGHYPVPPQAPKTLGVEFSGTVVKIASDVNDFKEGDEVFGLAYGGAYAEYIAVSGKMCLHKPKEFSWEQAAGIPEVRIFIYGADGQDRGLIERVSMVGLVYRDSGGVEGWGV